MSGSDLDFRVRSGLLSARVLFHVQYLGQKLTIMHRGSALLFRKLVEQLRPEDFEVEYRNKNRWTFLGNGFTRYELNPNNDLGWYIER